MNLIDFKNKVLPNKNKLFRVALRIVGDAAEAEDVVQEVFIKIWKRRADFSNIKNIDAFCMQMTKNLAIDKTRSKHKRTQELGLGVDFATHSANPHQQTETNDTISRIKRLVEQLPEKQQLVMQLRDIEDLSYIEISKALDMPMNQVKVNLFRARKKIRELLINREFDGLQ